MSLIIVFAVVLFLGSYSDRQLCDYEYVQQCRKFSTEIKLILSNKKQAVYNILRTTESSKNLPTNQVVVSQKEINNLLGSFYTSEQRFRNILTAKDLVVCCIFTESAHISCVLVTFAEFSL